MLNHKGTQILETERLILRRFTVDDAEAMYKNWASDGEVTRYLRWRPHESLEETAKILRLWEAEYDSHNKYHWAVCLKTGEPIGSLGVMDISDFDGRGELGYCIGRAYWGKGYMPEALKTVLFFLFSQVGFNRMEAYHSVNNPASGRVMQKTGMTREGFARQKYFCYEGFQDCDGYGITRDEWEKKR